MCFCTPCILRITCGIKVAILYPLPTLFVCLDPFLVWFGSVHTPHLPLIQPDHSAPPYYPAVRRGKRAAGPLHTKQTTAGNR
jgi:hypothetical protein